MSPVPAPSNPSGSKLLPPLEGVAVPRAVSTERERTARLSPHGPRSRVMARRRMLGLPPAMLRRVAVAVGAVALAVAVIFYAPPDHDRAYWESFRALDGAAPDYEACLRQLPVQQVRDSALRAFHYAMLEELDLAQRVRDGEASALPALLEAERRLDDLRVEVARRYE